MPQKVSRLVYKEMVNENDPKLEIINRLYSNGPIVPVNEVKKWTDIADPDKIYKTLESWVKLNLVEKAVGKDYKDEFGRSYDLWGGKFEGYRISPTIFHLVEDNFSKKNVNYK